MTSQVKPMNVLVSLEEAVGYVPGSSKRFRGPMGLDHTPPIPTPQSIYHLRSPAIRVGKDTI